MTICHPGPASMSSKPSPVGQVDKGPINIVLVPCSLSRAASIVNSNVLLYLVLSTKR